MRFCAGPLSFLLCAPPPLFGCLFLFYTGSLASPVTKESACSLHQLQPVHVPSGFYPARPLAAFPFSSEPASAMGSGAGFSGTFRRYPRRRRWCRQLRQQRVFARFSVRPRRGVLAVSSALRATRAHKGLAREMPPAAWGGAAGVSATRVAGCLGWLGALLAEALVAKERRAWAVGRLLLHLQRGVRPWRLRRCRWGLFEAPGFLRGPRGAGARGQGSLLWKGAEAAGPGGAPGGLGCWPPGEETAPGAWRGRGFLVALLFGFSAGGQANPCGFRLPGLVARARKAASWPRVKNSGVSPSLMCSPVGPAAGSCVPGPPPACWLAVAMAGGSFF